MIKEKYSYLGLYKGAQVLVFTVDLDGEPATISCINDYGNVVVKYNKIQIDDEGKEYSGQLVHPLQVKLNVA